MTGASELRQFACGPCQHSWWTFVPRTKPVSSCRKCHVRYDALDRSKEFGIGRYWCPPCDHFFYAWCEATHRHMCFHCKKLTGSPYINPRFKPIPRGGEIRKFTAGQPRTPRIFNESTVHDSTGSTVSTFLTTNLGPDINVYVVPVQDIWRPMADEPPPQSASPDPHLETEHESADD